MLCGLLPLANKGGWTHENLFQPSGVVYSIHFFEVPRAPGVGPYLGTTSPGNSAENLKADVN